MSVRQILFTVGAVALSAHVSAGQAVTAALATASPHVAPFQLDAAHRVPPNAADTAKRPSRRSTVTGAVTGALIGGLATAGFVLNATAYDCVYNVTSGSPCPKKNYVLLHTVTIAAGAT
ncbi:MAG TPA: hypothetical protein VLN49_07145, partial [Gemmatimonadaceae bacterium]|nr:hypothetical protein [Gemmatimonadaceae bacterium]